MQFPPAFHAVLVSLFLAWTSLSTRVPEFGRLLAVCFPPARLRRWGFVSLALAGGLHAVSGATAPAFASPLDVQVQVGTSFGYRIAINQAWPLNKFDASPLPPGLTVNKRFGSISGKPTQIGTNSITLVASQDDNPDRTLTGTLVLRVIAGPAPPLFQTDPTNVVALAGDTVVFSSEAVGAGTISYQWYRGSVFFGRFFLGPAIPDATAATFTIAPAGPNDAGWYVVKASNAAGTNQSQPAQLSMILPPDIYSQPSDTTVHEGMPVSLFVGADGGAELNIQWRKDGVPVAGATNAFYGATQAARSMAGVYDAVLDNAAGHAVSDKATIRIVNPLVPRLVLGATGEPTLGFETIPGGYYTIYYSETIDGDWTYLADVSAVGTNSTRAVGSSRPIRYFRVGAN